MKYSGYLRMFWELSIWKTLYMNFRCFPFNIAFKFPILCSRHLRLRALDGTIRLGESSFGCVRLGFDGVGIFDNKKSRSIIHLAKGGTLELKGKAIFGHGFKLSINRGGVLSIGQGFVLTAESSMICSKKIQLGNGCMISWGVLIMDTDFHKIYIDNNVVNPDREIIIGNNVWVGCRSTVLKGAQIPDGSIIAAGSIVANTLTDSNSIYGGSPLRQIKNNIYWER